MANRASANLATARDTIAIRLLSLGCVVFWTLGCAVAADQTTTAPSRVSVTFVEPEHFTDARDGLLGSPKGSARILAELGRYLRTAGEQYVAPDHALDIRVTDVDLAGEFEPGHGPQWDRVRVMRDLYAPRIELSFTLTDGRGDVVKEGRRTLTPSLYIVAPAQGEMDALRYDKQLLGDWLRQEFTPAPASSRLGP